MSITNDIVPHSALGTSYDSARAFEESGLAGIRGQQVYKFIQDRPERGATCFEIEAGLGLPHQTVSGRIWALRTKLALVYSEETRVNPASERNCEVYRVVTDLEYAQSVDPRCGRSPGKYVVTVYDPIQSGFSTIQCRAFDEKEAALQHPVLRQVMESDAMDEDIKEELQHNPIAWAWASEIKIEVVRIAK